MFEGYTNKQAVSAIDLSEETGISLANCIECLKMCNWNYELALKNLIDSKQIDKNYDNGR